MKNIFLSFTKKLIAVFIILELCSFTTFAGSGIFESYVIVQANGGSVNYYDLFASTANPDFQGLNLGTFTCTNSLVIKGGQNKTYKNGTDNILNGYLYYRVYKNGSDPNLVSFTSINLGFDINLNGSGDQQWTNAGATANVLQGLANGTYTIEVYSSADFTYNGGNGTHYQNVGGANYKATFTVSNPINVTTQPVTPAAFCSGTNVTLTAAATGADAYIWQEEVSVGNWSNISGANGSMNIAGETVSLTLTNLTTTKKVRCLFTNCGGINTLATSEITLTPQLPNITLQPVSQTDCEGNTVDFTINTTNNANFQWQKKRLIDASFTNISGANSTGVSTSTLTITTSGTSTAANPHLTEYRCIITDANSCSITSNVAVLSVNTTTKIPDREVCQGQSTTFTAPTVGTINTIKWQKRNSGSTIWNDISGANTTTLTLTNIPISDNGSAYRVVIIFDITVPNNNGISTCQETSSTTEIGLLSVKSLPTAPTANNASRCDAGTVTLSATSALNTNESFRWYETDVSTTVLGTATNYTTTSLAVGTYTYYLSVYNSSTTCESTRTPITVTVNALPTITLGSVADICNSVTSFSLPFSATTGSPNQYSISAGSPALSGFSTVSNATLGSSPIDATIPANATANTYQFIISVKNSSTTCVSTDQTFTVKINNTPAAPTVTSSINYCQNAPTTILSATASGTNTLLWYGTSSSGGTSSLTAPTPSSTAIGTTSYYVSQKNSDNCESARAVINVIINAIPNAPSATTAVVYCKNSTATVLTATAAGSNSLIWYDENDNILGAAPTPNTTTVGTQIYKVSQKSPAPANCESPKTTITVTINDLPPVPTVTTPVGYCQNATATALSATATGTNALLWYGTNAIGGTSSGTAPTPLTTSTGTTSYYVSQKDANNCESLRAKIDVEITPSVSATITGINAFCITGVLNNSTTLTANPTGGNGTYTYQWQNLAGNISSAMSQTYNVNSTVQSANSDTYRVTVNSGNCTATANLTVTRQGWGDVPSVSGNTPDICGSGSKTLSIVSPSVSGIYKWYADATTLTQTAAGTSFSTPNLTSITTYYVAREQQITANLTCQTVRTATTINVNAIPETPTIVNSANKTILCNNESGFTLSVSCTSGSGQYRLNSGSWTNGSSVTITPSSYSSVSTLNYDFKCSLSTSCESAVASTSITINPVPNAPTISGNTSICAGSSTTLTASGCTGTVVWSNGVTANTLNVSAAGTYNATCTINGCVSLASVTQTIVVNSIPATPIVVSDDADNIVCAGINIKLSVSDCAGTVVWSNGTSATSITVSSTGTYNATCKVNACTSPVSATQNIVVNQNPSITLGSINSICNAATTFDLTYSAAINSPDKYSLTSAMPDFVAVAETNLPASPILVTIPSGKTGTYSFTLNIKNSTNTCLTAQNFNVTVLSPLLGGSIETSSSTINCSGYNPSDIASVSLGSGGKLDYVYQWQSSTDNQNFTDITGANLPNYNPPLAISQTTYYRRKVTDVCGVEAFSSNVHQVQIVADPQISITDATERVICSGGSISLEATVIGGSGTCTATWQSSATQSGTYTNEQVGGLSFSTTLTNSSSTPLVKYYKVIYACSGTGSSACGQATSTTVKVTVNYIPIAPVVSGTTSICAGASTILTATGCTGTVNWNTGAVGSTISANIAGTYSATCTQSACTSNASNIHTLTVNPIPSPPTITSDDADNTVCAGTSVVLTASNCAGTVIWSNNITGNSITVSSAMAAASGTYNATCTVNNCVSLASDLQTITVNPIPNAPTLTGNTSICSGNSTILTASGCTGTITWNTGAVGSTINIISAGTFNATCTINNCVSIASEVKTVLVNSIPNAPTISGNTAICQGLSTTLTASGCAGIITWSTGATGSTISASVGTYSATCTENSCVSSVSTLHTIFENGLPTITLSAINNICNAATSFELAYSSITNSPDRYSLTSTMPDFVAVSETSLPSSPITVTIPSGKVGTHTFTLAIKNATTGCVNSQNFNATILPVLIGGSIEASPITINCAGYNPGSISSVSLASGGKIAYTYQWQSSINGVDFADITTATSTVYDPVGLTETTYYRRKVTDACGAEAYSSNIHQITIVPDPAITISSDKTAVCAGGAVNFSQTVLQAGTGTCTTTWKSSSSVSMISPFTEGTGSSLLLNLNNSGTTAIKKYFQATYDCSVSSCNNAVSNVIEITINPTPSVPTVSGGGTICSGSSTTLTASGCNGTLLWSNGATSSSISVSAVGSYSVVCTNSCGTSAASNEIVVNVTTVSPPTLTGTTTVCNGQSATLTATGCAGTVVWSNASSGTSISVSPSTTTSYTAVCNASSCTSVNSEPVTVTVAPSIDFTLGSVADLCNSTTSFSLPYNLTLGSSDKYTLTSTMAGFTSITDANLGASPITVTIPSGQTGTFSFTLTLKISSTGCSKSQTFNVNILPALSGGSIEASSSTINCSGYNAGAISSVSLASGGKTDYVYQWQSSTDNVNFIDISGANLTTYDPPALTQTTYYRRKVTDACGAEAISSNVHQIQIVPDPQITISDATDRTICSGGSISLEATVIGGSGTCTPTWQSSSTQSGTYTNEQVGGLSFAATLTNTTTATITKYYRAIYACSGSGSGSCNQGTSVVVKVIINPTPSVPTVSGGGTICSGSSTTLTASGCNGTLLWSNGATSSSISVSAVGSYSVVCTNSCGTSAASNEIVVNVTTVSPPTLTGTTTVCNGQSATLTATGCAGTVVWSNASSGTSISVSPSTTTSYTAVCNASSCTSINSEPVTVTVAPSIDFTLGSVADLCNSTTNFSLPYNLTLGSSDKYTLTSTMAGFTSITDANLGASPITVTIPSGQTGTFSFTLTLKISSTGCSKSQTFNVNILPVLSGGSIETSSSTINCSGYNAGAISSVSLASGGKIDYVYQWQSSTDNVNFTDISGANLTTYDPPALTQTTYYRRKITDACGAEAISSNIHQIQIVPDPQITISDATDRTICSGGSISLEATVIGGSGTCTPTWQSSSTQSGTYTNEQVGGLSFTATLTNTTTSIITKYYRAIYACSGGGSGSCNQGTSAVVKVIINPSPSVPTVSGGGTICSGSSTTLTASGCNGTLLWSNGATSSSISVPAAGSYSAVCTNSCGTSAASNEIVVNVTTVSPPTLTGTSTVCSGQSATLTATGCAGTVVWSNASSGTSITVSPSTTTSYTAVCKANGCTSINSEAVLVTVTPSIDFTVGSVADLCNSAMSFSLPYNLTLGSPDKYSLTSTMAGFISISDANLGASPITVTIPSGQTGTFSFTLTLKISSTGCSKSQTFNVNILPVLSGGSIETSSSTINCSGYNAGAISSVSLASGGKIDYVYQWQSSTDNVNFTDISGANLTTYDPPALTQTTYYRRKVIDACGAEAISSNVHQIQIVPDPQITITDATDRTICSGGNVSLEATVIGGSGTCTPTWQSSSTQSGTYTNEQVGGLSFAATLTNTTTSIITKYYRAIYACSGGGSGSCNQGTSAVVKVIINPTPSVPTVSGGGTICSGSSTTLIASGCNGNLLWSNTATSTSISISAAGSYSAVCTNSCGTSAASNAIIVNVMTVNPPTLAGATTICGGQPATLTASGCAGTVVWSNASSGTSITVSPSTTTSYTAVCKANGCTSINSEAVLVTVTPSIDFTVGSVADLCNSATSFSLPYNLTLGSPDKYSLTSTMAGFISISDANLGASPISVTIPNGQIGIFSFTLTLKISSTGCIKSQTFNVNILPALSGGSIEASSSTINCSGYNAGVISSVSLASGGKIDYVYQWQSSADNVNFTDISGANLTTYDPPALTQTTYYRRKVTDACGAEAISSNIHQIQIVPDPQITITDATDRTICSGGSISLEATVIGGSGTCTPTWQSSSTQSGTYTNEQVGGLSFVATLTNTTVTSITKYYRAIYACSGGGSGSCNQGTSAVVKVTINPIPNTPIITPASVMICPTQSTSLTASGCSGIVTWNGGQTGSTLSVSEAGTYAATCSLNSCVSAISSSATVTVASGGTPVVPPVISGTATICSGQFTTLIASNCTGLVTWNNGATGTSISVNPSISTDYTATCFDGTCTSNSSNKITVTVNTYPSITTQPKNEADCNGNSVTFSVAATSVTNYQWQRKIPNGTFTDISGAVANTLTISNVGSLIDPNQTEYRVVLSNQSCSVTSTVALLTVNSVVGSLADQTICDRASVSFNLSNIVISGSIQSYQWQRRVGTSGTWNDISGATTTTLTINAATNADEQYYRCKVNFTAGSSICARYTTEDDSNGAKLTVLVASTPTITGTNVICKGKNTTLTANNCDGTIAWSSGQSTATITVSPTANTSYTVSCTSTQCGFSVISAPYLVSVTETPQPEIITYDVITPATLTFAARTTVPNATLMWYNRASGGIGTTIAPSFTAVGTYSYWVTQTDPITGCESARLPIIAKVLDYFHITQQPSNQVDCRGNSVFLGVVAVGPNPAFTYQWQRRRPNEPDFVNLVEEGNGIRGWYARTMAVSNVGDVNNPNKTQYRCIVSNNGQFITSEISTLTVNSLVGSMPNLGICVGATNEFNLQNYFTITGNVMSYQWQTRPGTSGAWTNLNDGNGISGSNKSVLKFTNATYEQGVYYRCLVKFNTQGFECTEPTDAAKLIVSGFPPAPSVSSVFYCQNANAVRLKVDSPVQNLVWYSQETGGTGNSTAPTPNTSVAGVFKYYVADRTDEGCEGPRAIINVEVGATPPAPKNTTPISVNEGSVLTFSAEGNPSTNQILRWYTSPTITTFTTTAPTFTAAGTYTRYVAQLSAFGCVGPRTAITATIIPSLKFTKQPLSQADCDGNSVTFSVTATAPSTFTYQWQRQKSNETSFTDLAGENTNTLKISNVGNTANPNLTKYRCIIKDDKNTVISEEATLTVNQIVGTLATMSLCDGKASKLTFSSLSVTGNVAEYQWQKKVGSTYTDIPTNANGVAIINEVGTYRGKIIFIVDKTTTCNRTTDDLKVEVKPTPTAPQVANQNACLNTPFEITKAVTASSSLLWYESATDTIADNTTPKIDVSKLAKTTFFVSQITNFGCESERKSFDVVVAAIPEKPILSDLSYCRNAPSVALTATTSPQNQVLWYSSLTSKDVFAQTPTPSTKLDGETTYFAATKNAAGCESERVPLKVSVAPCIATFESNLNNCLQVSADSVKGNQWFDLYDKTGRLYASVNPNGLNLGKVSISIRHYGRGSAAIPATKNDTKLMARYVDFQSSLLNEFATPVSLKIYYENSELNDYKTATNLPNLTINDFNIVHYDGIREDCGFENNDNFVEGESYVIYKNVIGNQIAKDFFYLQFDVSEFSENGATANDFTEITFSGKETEKQTVQLNWQSKYEIKAEKYILERSADCKNFTKIGEIKANGMSSIYENIDFQPLAGKSCYRLVYIDQDGTKKYLDAIEINFTDKYPVCSVFPNPWTKGDEINLYLRNIKEKEIKLYDMRGQEFSFNMNKNESQIIKIRPDVYLSKGIHFLVVIGEDGKKCVQKVVINP